MLAYTNWMSTTVGSTTRNPDVSDVLVRRCLNDWTLYSSDWRSCRVTRSLEIAVAQDQVTPDSTPAPMRMTLTIVQYHDTGRTADLPLLEVQLRREALAEPPAGRVEQELVPRLPDEHLQGSWSALKPG